MEPAPNQMPYSTEWADWLRKSDPAMFKFFKEQKVHWQGIAEREGIKNPAKAAWYAAARMCGYSVSWKPTEVVVAAQQEADRKAKELESQKRAEKRIQQQVQKLVAKELDLPEELGFALNNLHLIPDPSKAATWKVLPEQAPSLAAWNVLMLAATSKTKFLEMVTKELLSSHAQERKATGGTVASEDADLEEVRKMLQDATASA